MDQAPQNLHFYYDDPLALLPRFAENLKQTAQGPSVSGRRQDRLSMYIEMGNEIHRHVLMEWETFIPDPEAVSLPDDAAPKGDLPQSDDEPEKIREKHHEQEDLQGEGGLTPELADEVKAALEEGETDLTQSIAVAVVDPEAGLMPCRYVLGTALSDVLPEEVEVKRLRRIFRRQESLMRRSRRKRTRRGLAEGKLDPARLYRVPLDGRVFRSREAPGTDYLWQICIVADASASMGGKGPVKPWDVAQKTFVSLAEAAKNFRNIVDIHAYHEEQKVCTLIKLNHGGRIHTVMPSGRTPSGQAILAAATLMKKKYKNSMIIHITDGASNCGLRLSDAVDYCNRNDIDIFTIGCGCNRQTREFLREYFLPGRIFFMKDIRRLSDGLERLFKEKML